MHVPQATQFTLTEGLVLVKWSRRHPGSFIFTSKQHCTGHSVQSNMRSLLTKTSHYSQDLRQQWLEPGCWPAVFVKTMGAQSRGLRNQVVVIVIYGFSRNSPNWQQPRRGNGRHTQTLILIPSLFLIETTWQTRRCWQSGEKSHTKSTVHWLPVAEQIDFKILLITFQLLNDVALSYLKALLTPYNPPRAMRSTNKGFLIQPRFHLESYGYRAFLHIASRLWIAPPDRFKDTKARLPHLSQKSRRICLNVFINCNYDYI